VTDLFLLKAFACSLPLSLLLSFSLCVCVCVICPSLLPPVVQVVLSKMGEAVSLSPLYIEDDVMTRGVSFRRDVEPKSNKVGRKMYDK